MKNLTIFNTLKRIFDTKRILLAVALMLALPALILCQTNGKTADKKGGDEQAVRQVIKELAAALGSNDSAALDRIYADGLYICRRYRRSDDQSATARRV